MTIVSHTYNTTAEFYTITLDDDMEAGEKYKIHIEFTALVAHPITYGLYRSSYLTDDGEIR